MIVDKVYNSKDQTLDIQITKLCRAINRLTPEQIKAAPAPIPVVVNVACTDSPSAIVLLNQIRAALIAYGICA